LIGRDEAPDMDYRTIGASDLVVSVLSLGTATFGGVD
jgi:aryl-alcohol dehydrogenase-like predicted oxidoreductase